MGLDHRSMPRPPQDPPPPQANPFSSTRICDAALLLQAQKQQLSLARRGADCPAVLIMRSIENERRLVAFQAAKRCRKRPSRPPLAENNGNPGMAPNTPAGEQLLHD